MSLLLIDVLNTRLSTELLVGTESLVCLFSYCLSVFIFCLASIYVCLSVSAYYLSGNNILLISICFSAIFVLSLCTIQHRNPYFLSFLTEVLYFVFLSFLFYIFFCLAFFSSYCSVFFFFSFFLLLAAVLYILNFCHLCYSRFCFLSTYVCLLAFWIPGFPDNSGELCLIMKRFPPPDK